MSLPGKGLEVHICPIIVTSWWRHCDVIERHELGGAKNIIALWSRRYEILKYGE